ncbi:MAG: hypothetical protein ACFCUQ_01315 [Kiloniellales bacterium]
MLAAAALVGAVVVFTALREWLWYWMTVDYRDGAWAQPIVENLQALSASGASADLAIQAGAQGKLVWAALTLLVLIFIVVVAGVSAWICLMAFRRHRIWAAFGIAILIGLTLLPYYLFPSYEMVLCADTDGPGCSFALTARDRFFFTPYSYVIFKQVYSADLAAFYWRVMQAEWALLNPVNLLALLAVIALLAEGRDERVRRLAGQVAQYRVFLLVNSGLVTVLGLATPAELGWLAEVVERVDPQSPVPFRELQLGITLFLGITNSLFLALLFVPLGGLLWLRARRFAREENPEANVSDLERWEKDKGVAIFAHGPLLQIGSIFAPLVIGGGVSLLRAAIFAG